MEDQWRGGEGEKGGSRDEIAAEKDVGGPGFGRGGCAITTRKL